jgi:peptide deformylase
MRNLLLPAIEKLLTDRMIYPHRCGNWAESPRLVTVFDEDLKKLVEDMFASMYAAHGVGLAAPQIGISNVWRSSTSRLKRILTPNWCWRTQILYTEGRHSNPKVQHPRVPRTSHASTQGHHSRAGRRASG